jgi:hypothetical protein
MTLKQILSSYTILLHSFPEIEVTKNRHDRLIENDIFHYNK